MQNATEDWNNVLEDWATHLNDEQGWYVGHWPQTFQPQGVKALKLFPNHMKQQGTLVFVKPDRYVLYFYEDSYHVKVNSITTFQFDGAPASPKPFTS